MTSIRSDLDRAKRKAYSLAEEIANSVSHGIGAALSVAALTLMVVVSVASGDGWKLTSALVYGISLVFLFLASTLYHAIVHDKVKGVLRLIDHCAIYLLIAGTYTPFLLINLRGAWGWTLFAVIWSLALFGIFFKLFFKHRFPKLSLFTYILMGWLVIVALSEMLAKVPSGAMWLLLAGGLVYTLGAVFYKWEKLPFNHAIWHLFVLGGSTCHFLAVYLYVM
ncbi:PAQR family membrane homeostasis protein TrhA [Simiduia agarivorans]|uniref:Hemolysin III family channel protein n=1 Tax=Simiduia agarivorans (strain DSM 21679 / JCM 13881 / BCRC 17597 / SA1) TaxID=1117647 RepID=K4KJ86_SIMAS|nr:hemolysin III family protein [Simiduia agarivorans]AFU99106.1 hemolysin III family channel protein [Simiduia agarivorans SA1 = DSM 21679]